MLASINKIRPGRTRMRDYDLALRCAVGALVILSLIMVYSASIAIIDDPKGGLFARYSFVIRQGVFVLVGWACAWLIYHIRMDVWARASRYLFLIGLVLLAVVLIPHIGRQINGAWRWIPLPMFNLQPSEFMKFAIILYTADYVTRKNQQGLLTNLLQGLVPIFIALAVVCMLIMMEPDLGAVAVIGTVCFAILYLGGLQMKVISILVLGSAMLLVMMIYITPWRLKRFMSYLDPFSEEYAQSTGYQLVHSLIAIGRGGWDGVGLGFSVEKLHYLPEAHTDFIMAVIGEELGFAGMAAVVLCYLVIVWKGFKIGRHAMIIERYFAGYVAQGVAVWIGVQSLINLGVCLGILPTKGLTLPLVSYGGSAMVMNLAMIALLMRVDYENRQLSRGQTPRRREAP